MVLFDRFLLCSIPFIVFTVFPFLNLLFKCKEAALQVLMHVCLSLKLKFYLLTEFRMFQCAKYSRMHAECSKMQTECSRMHTECSRMHTECSRMHAECSRRHVECSKIHTECSRMHTECFRMHVDCSRKHAECSRMHEECSRIQNVPKCMQIYELACNYTSLHAVT